VSVYNKGNRKKTVVVFYLKPLPEGEGYGISLDHRSLRTPLRKMFIVPNEGLAVSVAQEWSRQDSIIRPSFMHLVNTVTVN